MMIGDNDDNVSVASVESNKFVAVTHPMSPANSPNSAGKKIEFRLSKADHNSQKETKGKLAESKIETDLEVKLKEKLNSKKDEDGFYGDLLATS